MLRQTIQPPSTATTQKKGPGKLWCFLLITCTVENVPTTVPLLVGLCEPDEEIRADLESDIGLHSGFPSQYTTKVHLEWSCIPFSAMTDRTDRTKKGKHDKKMHVVFTWETRWEFVVYLRTRVYLSCEKIEKRIRVRNRTTTGGLRIASFAMVVPSCVLRWV